MTQMSKQKSNRTSPTRTAGGCRFGRGTRWSLLSALGIVWLLTMDVVRVPAAPFGYISNSADTTVSVFDTATNTVVATIPSVGGIFGYPVAVHPSGRFVYVGNSVINTATNSVVATLPFFGFVGGVAVHPAGTFVYLTKDLNGFQGDLVVINTATNTVATTVAVGGNPNGVAVHPAGTFVYVANLNSQNVSVINTATNTVVATVPVSTAPVSGRPYGMAMHPTGTFVYVTKFEVQGSVAVIDTATNTVVATVPVGSVPAGVAVHPAGTFVYAANEGSDTVSVISTATNTVSATVPVGIHPYGVSVHPAGTFVYVANQDSNTVSVIDTATNVVSATIPVGRVPLAFGQFIGGSTGASRLCKAEPTGEVIQYGDLITCQIFPVGDRDTFRFSGLPNEKVIILTARTGGSTNFFPCIELLGPGGTRVSSACGAAANRIDVLLEQAGTHTISIRDDNNAESGTYSLNLQRISPLTRFGTPIKYGQTLTGQTIDIAGDLKLLVLSGTKGNRISLQTTRTGGGNNFVPCIELFGPDGTPVSSACGSATNRIDATLTQDGTHTLLVRDDNYNDTGTYSVTLQCGLGTCIDAIPTVLAAAVLPSSRSVQVGTPATAFATIINTGSASADAAGARAADGPGPDALGCSIVQVTGVPSQFSFQATDAATNQLIGSPDTPVNILPGANQSFVISVRPSAPFCPTNVQFGFKCSNGTTSSIVGLNTLLVTASNTPVPDIIALAATVNGDGIVNLPGPTGAGAFAVATSNVGASGTVIASASASDGSLPVSVALCQTNPATGQCLAPPAPTVTTAINANATPTFGVFVTGSGAVPFNPANNRIFVRFNENVACGGAGTVTRGSTSVAVRTQ